MDQITETKKVNEALTAKSKTTSLDELARRGKKQVKVIRAGDIAAMITETVYRVCQDAEVLTDQDLEHFVQRSKAEFQQVLKARQKEDVQRHELETRLAEAHAAVQDLEQRLAAAETAASPAVDAQSADLMMRMMTEMAEMKAGMAQQPKEAVAEQADDGAAGGIAAALDKISTSLEDRLDKFGRKMGISSAVEAAEVKYDSLFNDDQDSELESNMGDVQLKKKTGAGIAGNLERLKKLKGGG